MTISLKLKIAVVIWILAVVGGLFYFSMERLVYFDPNNVLLDRAITTNFQSDFIKELESRINLKAETTSGKVIHFTSNHCSCNFVANSHISAVKNQVNQEGFENIDISLGQNDSLTEFIPSTPAVALFNDSGKLIFLGPYSTGYLCSAGNGFVEDLISQMDAKGKAQPLIVSIARGCYCNS